MGSREKEREDVLARTSRHSSTTTSTPTPTTATIRNDCVQKKDWVLFFPSVILPSRLACVSFLSSCRMTTRMVPSVLSVIGYRRRGDCYCYCDDTAPAAPALVAAVDGSCRIDDERVNGMNESSLRGSVNWNGIGSDRD
mmetsp:Transcript_36452/g.41264  ORF Transcript_36452/g.41264 Transcript_36452/m.41264 type:complete len:139 (-) Transcript_36452:824-1240(-)